MGLATLANFNDEISHSDVKHRQIDTVVLKAAVRLTGCRIEPSNLTAELGGLKIGRPAAEWYGEEITRLQAGKAGQDPTQPLPWTLLQNFFAQEVCSK